MCVFMYNVCSIDQFTEVLAEFISSLRAYLTRGEMSIERDASKLIKMIAINISTVHHIIDNTSTYMYMYIRRRERERERIMYIYMYMHV